MELPDVIYNVDIQVIAIFDILLKGVLAEKGGKFVIVDSLRAQNMNGEGSRGKVD
jgi:hypothetical protein